MTVVRAIKSPYFLQGLRPAIVQIGSRVGHAEQVRSVKGFNRIVLPLGAHVKGEPDRIEWRRMTGHTAIRDGDRFAVRGFRRKENRAAKLLSRAELSIRHP